MVSEYHVFEITPASLSVFINDHLAPQFAGCVHMRLVSAHVTHSGTPVKTAIFVENIGARNMTCETSSLFLGHEGAENTPVLKLDKKPVSLYFFVKSFGTQTWDSAHLCIEFMYSETPTPYTTMYRRALN